MISNPYFLVSIVMSTVLSFFTTAFLVEMFLKVLKGNFYRTRFFLRLLPFFTLLADRIFGCFSLGNWFNPLNCQSCVQKIVLESFFSNLKNYLSENEISLVRYLAKDSSHFVFSLLFSLFCVISLFWLTQVIYQGISTFKSLRIIERTRTPCTRSIKNALLKDALERSRVNLWMSENVFSPMVSFRGDIYLPTEIMEQLTQTEYEAILAHELEHIRWKDGLINFIFRCVSAVFWWIPTTTWWERIEQDQEMSCDAAISQYHLDGKFLASAILKVFKKLKFKINDEFCYLTKFPNKTKSRLEAILGVNAEYKITGYYCLAVVVATVVMSVCMSWR